jgi:hypothetical protein
MLLKELPKPGSLYYIDIDFLEKKYNLFGIFLRNYSRNRYNYDSFYDFFTHMGIITVYISDYEFVKHCRII